MSRQTKRGKRDCKPNRVCSNLKTNRLPDSEVDADEDAVRYTPSEPCFKPWKRTRFDDDDDDDNFLDFPLSVFDGQDINEDPDKEPGDKFLERRQVAHDEISDYWKAYDEANRMYRGDIPIAVHRELYRQFFPARSASELSTEQERRDRSTTPVADRQRESESDVGKGRTIRHSDLIAPDAELESESEDDFDEGTGRIYSKDLSHGLDCPVRGIDWLDESDEVDETEYDEYNGAREAALKKQDRWNDFSNDPSDESTGFQSIDETLKDRLRKATPKAPRSLIEFCEARNDNEKAQEQIIGKRPRKLSIPD